MGVPPRITDMSLINRPKPVILRSGVIVSIPDVAEITYSVFDIAKDASIDLSSDITDYYTEDNSVLNDHIAKKPMIINVSGYKGELSSSTNKPFFYSTSNPPPVKDNVNQTAQILLSKMDVLNPLNPIMPSQIVQARQKISQLADKADLYKSNVMKYDQLFKFNKEPKFPSSSALKYVENNDKIMNFKKQTAAYEFFQHIRNSNILCNVFTPWGTFNDMAILTISAKQGDESNYITDFSLSFKKFNKTRTLYAKFDTKSAKSYITLAQKAEMQEVGKSIGKGQNSSLLENIVDPNHKMKPIGGKIKS